MNGDRIATGASSVASIKTFPPGISPSAAALPPPSSLSSPSRVSPFPSTTAGTKNAMAAPTFFPPTQSLRTAVTSQSSFPHALAPVGVLDRDAQKPIGTPYAASVHSPASILIRRLPLETSPDTVRTMLVFAKDLQAVDVLPMEQSPDEGYRSAVLKFATSSGALEAKKMLDGKSINSKDAHMIVELLDGSPMASRRYPIDTTVSTSASTTTSSAASSATSSRQASRFNGTFQALGEKMSAPLTNGSYTATDLSSSESSSHYQSIFSPQSPIGNHLTEHTRISGKTLINNDAADDDETGELLKDPLAYAENGSLAINQRRSTVPALPVSRLAGLSLNTAATGPATMPSYGHPGMASLPAHPSTMSPAVMGGSSGPGPFNPHYNRSHNYPPANPADQNPPCNTLYVGNLPLDTSEEELKALFSKQRGYRRLCYRTKSNGPMCFVEFEDVSAATKALTELYGHPLHNSVKGGIRLSFSKNPLGVRSSQNPNSLAAVSMAGMNGVLAGNGNTFTTASGPPPGLAAPPGLGMSRLGGYPGMNGLSTGTNSPYSAGGYGSPANNMWNVNYPPMAAGGPTAMLASSSSFPPHMMGR